MNLYIHAGHDKTGSSYIQSAIACSIIKLKERKIFYPANDKILRARDGSISSGNLEILYSSLDSHLRDADECDSILISNEKLFRFMPDSQFDVVFSKFLDYFKISSVNILLFTREPLEHLQSSYQQSVKRGGYIDTIDDFSSTYFHTKKVAQFVKHCISRNYNLKIHNYTKCNDKILYKFESWLGLPKETMNLPTLKLVNRSLTFGELEFQRVMNKYFGKNASILSNELCKNFPSIASDQFGLNPACQKAVMERVSPYCEFINNAISTFNNGSDTYDLGFAPFINAELKFNFTKDQIMLIGEVISKIKIINDSK
jgi:hypothetical protein